MAQVAPFPKSTIPQIVSGRKTSSSTKFYWKSQAKQRIQDQLEEIENDMIPQYEASYQQGIQFIQALPVNLMPKDLLEIDFDYDGDISFEWYLKNGWVFSISIDGTGRMSYAGLFGNSKTHGTEFLSEGVPKSIKENIKRILKEASS